MIVFLVIPQKTLKKLFWKILFSPIIFQKYLLQVIYIFALSDDAYQEVFKKISKNNHLTIHTSGSLDSKSLGIISDRWGCIYPLQSIKKDTKVNWEKVSFFIEAANEKDEKLLSIFCASNNMNFSILNSSKRKKLHLAAVASNNFTYHLLSMVNCIKN